MESPVKFTGLFLWRTRKLLLYLNPAFLRVFITEMSGRTYHTEQPVLCGVEGQ